MKLFTTKKSNMVQARGFQYSMVHKYGMRYIVVRRCGKPLKASLYTYPRLVLASTTMPWRMIRRHKRDLKAAADLVAYLEE